MLPLPVARLLFRSRNSKSPRDVHDTAYFALEVSLRMVVAAAPPEDPRPLARGSAGHWAAAAQVPDVSLTDEGVLALFELLAEGARSPDAKPAARRRSVTPRQVLSALAAYRNGVLGHGSVRAPEYYLRAGPILLAGVEACWRAGVFWPADARLVWIDALDATNESAQVHGIDLSGERPQRIDEPWPADAPSLERGQLYLRRGGRWRALFPWLLYEAGAQRVWCLNSVARRIEYLDYASGDLISGADLEARAAGVSAALANLFPKEALADFQRSARQGEGDPNRFEDFRILGKLGAGGMGVVYLARQESLGRLVALKMLPRAAAADPTALARFRREVRALSRCEHANVVKILSYGESHGAPYYAMEYVEGVDLARVLSGNGAERGFSAALSRAWSTARSERAERFPELPDVATLEAAPRAGLAGGGQVALHQAGERDVARVFLEAARGLAHLHERGIVHRDLSPANLMITWPDRRAVIMDLGLAALDSASLSLSRAGGRLVGTLRYMAPEQVQDGRDGVDARTDVYALGASMYELLCGRPLHDAQSEASLVRQILHDDPPAPRKLRPSLSEDLATIVAKATEREPRMRYASADELARDLERFLSGRPIAARPPTLGYVAALAVRRHKLLSALTALALLFLVGGLGGIGYVEAANKTEQDLANDVTRLPYLVEQAGGLWPCVPARAPALREWIAQAERLAARLDAHRARLARIDPGRADSAARGQRELVEGLERLVEPAEGLLAAVRGRLERAITIERRSLVEPADAWNAAIASIADPAACPAYHGLRIEPQLGLVPLGRDARSGLWEFVLLDSGEVPARDANGVLRIEDESAIVLVLIPGGTFFQGSSPEGLEGRNRWANPQAGEGPVRSGEIPPYFLSKYEMTQAQWQRAAGTNPSDSSFETTEFCSGTCPVEQVTWLDCQAVLARWGLTLPTECQWEYAARAGAGSVWPTGNDSDTLIGFANVAGLARALATAEEAPRHVEVGGLRPNAFGLHDVIGNVWEWCQDNGDYEVGTYRPSDGALEPNLDPSGFMHQCRGGSYRTLPEESRLASRYACHERFLRYDHGVRPARALDSRSGFQAPGDSQ